jgi:hypothetical protein
MSEEEVKVAERICRNCARFKVRRGKPYCSLLKQKVPENYTCPRFKSK